MPSIMPQRENTESASSRRTSGSRAGTSSGRGVAQPSGGPSADSRFGKATRRAAHRTGEDRRLVQSARSLRLLLALSPAAAAGRDDMDYRAHAAWETAEVDYDV